MLEKCHIHTTDKFVDLDVKQQHKQKRFLPIHVCLKKQQENCPYNEQLGKILF